jgi:hypothetical protein
MKNFCFLFLMFLIVNISPAQNSFLNYRMAVKGYNQSTYETRERSYGTGDTNVTYYESYRSFQLIQPAIAFQWKSGKSNFHEIEVSGIRLGKQGTKTDQYDKRTNVRQTVGGADIFQTSLAVRYEYILNFNKKADHKLVPSLGFGAGTQYSRVKQEPHISNSFPTASTQVSLKLYLTPRLTYYLNSKLFLDVNIPVCVSDWNTTVFHVENPAFTPSQQRSTNSTVTGFPKILSGRIGIGLKL